MKRLITLSLFSIFASAAIAQVSVEDPWVRATVPHQKSSGAFMRITSPNDARLLEVRSPVAELVEVHEMAMEGNVMKMRPVQGLDLPAGKAVELKPGGLHVMLIGLKGQMKEGDAVLLSLVVEGRDGKRETLEVSAPVRPLTQMQHGRGHGQ